MNEKHDAASIALAGLMRQASAGNQRTKRSAARMAIAEAIQQGIFAPGDYLPPETWLTEILGVSLGTVQAALQQLQQMGTIIRRRGDGTRVASTEPLARHVWHFRFVAKATKQPLRIIGEEVWIDQIQESGAWSDFLGNEPDYVRIRRRMFMQIDKPIGAAMYLKASMVPGLQDVDPHELYMVNIRQHLEERYGIAVTGATHLVQAGLPDQQTITEFGATPVETVFDIEAQAHTAEQTPVYYQRIIVSAVDCDLSF